MVGKKFKKILVFKVRWYYEWHHPIYDHHCIMLLCVCVCVCVHVRALSHVQVFVTPGRSPTRLLCPWNFPKQEYWIGLSFSLPGDLPDPGIKLASLPHSYFVSTLCEFNFLGSILKIK